MGLAAFRIKRERVKENPDQVTGRGFLCLRFLAMPESISLVVATESHAVHQVVPEGSANEAHNFFGLIGG